jgi:protein phosphatase
MYWEQSIQHAICTDLGLRRKNNEDAAAAHICTDQQEWKRRGHLLMVADGMGGHAVGELASRMAVETVPHSFLKTQERELRSALLEAVVLANEAIHQRGTQNPDYLNMGTTCSVLVLSPKGGLIAHVGDSRVYRVRRDRIDKLTFDHSMQWELEQLHGGTTPDLLINKNIITRSLGPEAEVKVDLEGPFPVLPGDTFVLCSDGVSNLVQDPEIGAIVRETSPKQAAQLLVHLANARGGLDNSTAIVVKVGDPPANLPPLQIDDDAGEDRLSLGWGWLISFWILSMLLLIGLAAMLLSRPLEGVLIASAAAVGLVGFAYGAIRRRRELRKQIERSDDSRTLISRPHRTAAALSSKELLEMLLKIDADLQRAAREDGWSIDWRAHDDDLKAAQEALRSKRYGRGVRDIGRAIDALMSRIPRGTAETQRRGETRRD